MGAPQLMTKYISDPRHACFNFPRMADDFLIYVTVYVKCRAYRAEQFKLDFHISLRGQAHAYCTCTDDPFPLMMSGRGKKKRQCMKPNCNEKDHYICSNYACKTRICCQCFDNLPTTRNTNLIPPVENDGVQGNCGGGGGDCEGAEQDLYDSNDDSDYEDDEDDKDNQGEEVDYAEYDATDSDSSGAENDFDDSVYHTDAGDSRSNGDSDDK